MYIVGSSYYKPIAEYSHEWNLGVSRDKDLIVRIRTGLTDAVGHPHYSVKLGIAIPLKTTSGSDIQELKDKVEKSLNKILAQNDIGVLVAILTSTQQPHFVEFLSYTKLTANFEQIHILVQQSFPDEEVQMYANEEPNWNTFTAFIPK